MQEKIFAINTSKYLITSESKGFEDSKIEGDKVTGFLRVEMKIIEKGQDTLIFLSCSYTKDVKQ